MNNMEKLPEFDLREIKPAPPAENVGDRRPGEDEKKTEKRKPKAADEEKKLPPDPLGNAGKNFDQTV